MIFHLISDDEWGGDEAKYGATKIPFSSGWYSEDTFFYLTYYNCQTRYGKNPKTCCGDGQKCLDRFSATGLKITNSPTFSASYHSNSSSNGTNYIELTTTKITSALKKENIESVFKYIKCGITPEFKAQICK